MGGGRGRRSGSGRAIARARAAEGRGEGEASARALAGVMRLPARPPSHTPPTRTHTHTNLVDPGVAWPGVHRVLAVRVGVKGVLHPERRGGGGGGVLGSPQRSLPLAGEVDAAEECVIPAGGHPLKVLHFRGQHNLAVVVAADGGGVGQAPAVGEHLGWGGGGGGGRGWGWEGEWSAWRRVRAVRGAWVQQPARPSPAELSARTCMHTAPCFTKMPLVHPAPCMPRSTSACCVGGREVGEAARRGRVGVSVLLRMRRPRATLPHTRAATYIHANTHPPTPTHPHPPAAAPWPPGWALQRWSPSASHCSGTGCTAGYHARSARRGWQGEHAGEGRAGRGRRGRVGGTRARGARRSAPHTRVRAPEKVARHVDHHWARLLQVKGLAL